MKLTEKLIDGIASCEIFFDKQCDKFVPESFFYEMFYQISNVFHKIRNGVYWFAYRFVSEYQYNIVRLKELKPGYYNPDTRILYAMMQILTDYVENECSNMEKICHKNYDTSLTDAQLGLKYLNDHINPTKEVFGEDADLEQIKANSGVYNQVYLDVYLWWKYEYPTYEKQEDLLHDEAFKGIDFSNPSQNISNVDCSPIWDMELVHKNKKIEMLQNLIKHMDGMWT